MIDLDENLSSPSFRACVAACELATKSGETVRAVVLDKEVYAQPGDNPHELYDRWGFYPT